MFRGHFAHECKTLGGYLLKTVKKILINRRIWRRG